MALRQSNGVLTEVFDKRSKRRSEREDDIDGCRRKRKQRSKRVKAAVEARRW